jgi:NAD(P)-dependent dehydrogenase (short-subunit alcohol dehydrogenase family)
VQKTDACGQFRGAGQGEISMSYFVTGATGFIGRFLVQSLLQRGRSTVYVLVRPKSMGKLDELYEAWGKASRRRVVPIKGDLGLPKLGVSNSDLRKLKGKIRHLYHLGAVYDIEASAAAMEKANIDGTRNALDFAHAVNAGCFHLVSSIAAAGLYRGTFTEDMFEEAEGLEHPYHRTKHDSEALVRANERVKHRIYRPGIVLGHSQTGYIDKIDGPYYFFKAIQKLRESWPRWIPLIGIEGGYINCVPVDFVVAALVHLSHQRGLDGRCFHLTDPKVRRIGETLNVFARAAHAPEAAVRIDPQVFSLVPEQVAKSVQRTRPIQNVFDQILRDLRIPKSVLEFMDYPTRFDSTETRKLLDKARIRVPVLEDYAWRLWDYWERHLDPDLSIDRSLKGAVKGKVVVITGGSSGIGEAAAIRVADAGGKAVIVARDPEKLAEVKKTITARGGFAKTYSCDITDYAANDQLAKDILKDFGHVDVLINNAGRSIRRSINLSYDRFHDYERTMQLNYFACVRLTLNLLPSMTARKDGQVVMVSSIGVLTNAPRFSSYVASKAALESFARCAASEFHDEGVHFTIINMPLVRTPMIAPTKIYDEMPTIITPDEAADMIADAIIRKPQRIATRLGVFSEILHLVMPKMSEVVMNSAYRMFPDSAAAQGKSDGAEPRQPTREAMIFASLMRGIHW